MNTLTNPLAPHLSPSPAERRRHQRVGVMMMATLRMTRGFFECMVLDISYGGAKLAMGRRMTFASGAKVTLIISHVGEFRAEPVWQRDDFIGLRFTDPPETVAAALGKLLPDSEAAILPSSTGGDARCGSGLRRWWL
jgi:hypothetical protein